MIFVTGGTGLIGRAVLGEHRARGVPARALVRSESGAEIVRGTGAEPVTGQGTDPAAWRYLEGCTGIIHAAALIAQKATWTEFERVNVNGTRLAAERARAEGVPLVHVSSVAVYGRTGDATGVDEDYAWQRVSDGAWYARSKRLAEEAVWREADRGLRAVAIRPCVVYGEHDRLFLPKLVRATRFRLMPIIGTGEQPLPLVHARNVAVAVVTALMTPAAWGRPFNTANDGEIGARAFLAAIGRGTGRNIRTLAVSEKAAMAGARGLGRFVRLLTGNRYPGSLASAVRFWRGGNPYSSERAKRDLGWRPVVKHEDGVEAACRAIER